MATLSFISFTAECTCWIWLIAGAAKVVAVTAKISGIDGILCKFLVSVLTVSKIYGCYVKQQEIQRKNTDSCE